MVGEAAALPLAISGPAGRPGALIGHLTVVRDDAQDARGDRLTALIAVLAGRFEVFRHEEIV